MPGARGWGEGHGVDDAWQVDGVSDGVLPHCTIRSLEQQWGTGPFNVEPFPNITCGESRSVLAVDHFRAQTDLP